MTDFQIERRRKLGTNERKLGINPRALGTNERARARNKWALRAWKRKNRQEKAEIENG